MTTDNQPIYMISDHTIDEQTFRAASDGNYNYYSWIQVYSKAYTNESDEELVKMQRAKISGIDHNDHFVLTLDGEPNTEPADAARNKWAELVKDFGWKVNSLNDKKFADLIDSTDIDLLRYKLYTK